MRVRRALSPLASVHVPAHDDLARERVCSRYLTRPAVSLARLGVRRDGLVGYGSVEALDHALGNAALPSALALKRAVLAG